MAQPPSSEVDQLRTAIAALEAQRSTLGDGVVNAALKPLRDRLAALQDRVDERKRVTILFADVSGFTALSETLDPEDVTAIMNDCFERLTAAIVRFGGVVDKYSGDAVMALFGAPHALENHAEMGVRAALSMQEALAQFSAELQQRRGFSLRMRIGLNTGEVLAGLVGGHGYQDYTVMGDAVNLASRLEHACPVGSVLISAATAHSLHALFEFEPEQQIDVKGKTGKIAVYVVRGLKSERGRVRGFANLSAPMIGRQAELAALQTICDTALRERRGQIVTVVGEVGIGKSRLRREFVHDLAHRYPLARVPLARCAAHTQAVPYHLLGELIRALLEIDLSEPPQQVRDRLRAALRTIDHAVDEVEFNYRLASLALTIGLPLPDDPLRALEPAQQMQRLSLTLETVVLGLARHSPLIILIEDLHWIDEASLACVSDLVEALVTDQHDQPVLLVLFGRPADDPHDYVGPFWARLHQPPYQIIPLRLLDEAQVQLLIDQLLAPADLSEEIVALIVERAQGNPFFVEELIRLFIESGALRFDETSGRWQDTGPLAADRVPDSVQGVLAARLDRLPPDDKRAAQYASIIGRHFWPQLLQDLLAQPVDTLLRDLEERRLVQPLADSQLADDREWQFRYLMVQEVAYRSVTKALRHQLHRQVADWLEAKVQDRRAAFLPLLAHHCEQAELADRALNYLIMAADQAARASANQRVVDFMTRALKFAANHGARFDLLSRRQRAWGQLGERDRQWADLQEMLTLAETLGDEARRAQTLNNLGLIVRRRRELDRALDYHQQALDLFRRLDDRVGAGRCLYNIGTVYWLKGDTAQAFAHYTPALDLARQTGVRRDEGNCLSNLGTAHWQSGAYDNALDCYQQALLIHRAIDDRYHAAIDLTNIGEARRRLGQFAAAHTHLQEAAQICHHIADREGELEALYQLGLIEIDLDRPDDARSTFEALQRLARRLQNDVAQARAHYGLGLALLALDQIAAAQTELQQAAECYEQVAEPDEHALCLCAVSRACLEAGDAERARQWIDRSLEALGNTPDRSSAAPAVFAQRARLQPAEFAAREDVRRAYQLLVAQAERIGAVAARQSFLENVPLHRSIVRQASDLGLASSLT
jgi:class 3 adenylate cyclase/tetratricopeptide (TPR) repeat protein